MQDIVPRKSIQDVKKDSRRESPSQPVVPPQPFTPPPTQAPYVSPSMIMRPNLTPRRSPLARNIFLGGIFVIAAIFLTLTYIFPQATISIKPLTQVVNTKANDIVIASGAYTIDTVTKKGDTKVASSGMRPVSKKGTGEVVIYNAYSTTPQVLVANTRLANKDGKIYRITKQVTIPGYTSQGGKIIPGSVLAIITADQPGDTYNTPALDLTIFAYAGTAKGEKIYARTKSAIVGGATGTEPIVSQADVNKATADLNAVLQADLDKQLAALAKSDYFSTKDLVVISTTTEVTGDTVTVTITGSKAFVSKDALATALARTTNDPKLMGNSLTFEDKNLSLKLPSATLPEQNQPLTLLASGDAIVSAKIDEIAIKTKLADASKDNFVSVMQQFPQLQEVSFTMRPFWLRSFPDATHIVIEKQ